MHPIHDTDVLLLLAITLASKRKPAALDEIAVGLGMIQPRLPQEAKLIEAFARLSTYGLIALREGGYTLSIEAQKIMATVPVKGETQARIFSLKEKLASYNGTPRHDTVQPAAEELAAAISAWRASLPPPTKSERFAERKEKEKEVKRAYGRAARGPRVNH
ncbi:hypothetical protein [Uliginosibacterium sediminicola]|uniref:Uncharacterized protein n=1 Tax=Uliginosibacterium sediminicola TaxID=2024550 RepID=A0ABU9YXT5_9RHOO